MNRNKLGQFVSGHNLNKKSFNNFIIVDNYIKVFYKDNFFMIDKEDLNKINSCCWFINKNNYVSNSRRIKLTHALINTKEIIDHKNRNPLDNRKSNLRIANKSTNAINSEKRKIGLFSSKYKGVSYRKDRKKWRAYITFKQKTINLGYFNFEIEAAKAYNEAAIKYFGEFACLNKL